MTTSRFWIILVVLASLSLGGGLFAMANYHDDRATQSFQFNAGMAVFQYGFIALVVAAVAAVIWGTLRKSGRR